MLRGALPNKDIQQQQLINCQSATLMAMILE